MGINLSAFLNKSQGILCGCMTIKSTGEVMDKDTRKDIKTTFESLVKILSRASSAEVCDKPSPELKELLNKAMRYSGMLDAKDFEARSNVDFRFDIVRATDAIEIFLEQVGGIEDRDRWLDQVRERIRKVNDYLKGWAD